MVTCSSLTAEESRPLQLGELPERERERGGGGEGKGEEERERGSEDLIKCTNHSLSNKTQLEL